jgi:hypothetical protein
MIPKRRTFIEGAVLKLSSFRLCTSQVWQKDETFGIGIPKKNMTGTVNRLGLISLRKSTFWQFFAQFQAAKKYEVKPITCLRA